MQIRGGAVLPVLDAERPYVRLGIRDELHALGIGEATPWPAATPTVVETMARTLGEALPDIGFVDLDELPPLEAVTHALGPVERLLDGVKTARFALETALLDVVGQRLGRPMAACLTDSAGHVEVPCNALLDAAKDDLVVRAGELVSQGFSALKVKLRARDDAGFVREIEALRALRSVWHGELRLDPNGAWSIDEARKKLEILAAFAPRYVEQPVAAYELVALGQTACAWAADESLLLPGMPERLVESGVCAAFILKPALLGGLFRALNLAKLARTAGIDSITTHALDGPVGIAAACEFARSIEDKPSACGLDGHAGLSRYPSLAVPHYVRAGCITRPVLSGLGFTEEDRKRWIATV